MTTETQTPTRNILAIILGATVAATAAPALAMDTTQKKDVPEQVSAEDFQELSEADLKAIDEAQARGKRVIIGENDASASEDMVDMALEEHTES